MKARQLDRRLSAKAGPFAACLLLVVSGAAAQAADLPISGRVLSIRGHAAGTQVKFTSKDPAFPFPDAGTPDDPANAGLEVEVFTASEGAATLHAPPGEGVPGWTLGGRVATYRYRSGGPVGTGEIQQVLLRSSRVLRVRGRVGLTMDAAAGAAAIRVRMGSLRTCAVFSGPSVRRDNPGRFVGRHAPASALSDCSDEAILAALGFDCPSSPVVACGGSCPGGGVCAPHVTGGPCRCNFETQPCGGTAPACNGACPAGDQCWPIDGFIPGASDQCLCAPAGAPPCGTTGLSCGAGACPDGLVCEGQPGIGIYDPHCACVEPDAPCGPAFGVCPPDMQCVPFAPLEFGCAPLFCGGTYPTCGGTCGPDHSCVPLDLEGQGYCVCASTAGTCDSPSCDTGFFCPPGEACTFSGGSCGCSPLP